MGQIQDLEQRIAVAFARISATVEAMAADRGLVAEAVVVPGNEMWADLSAAQGDVTRLTEELAALRDEAAAREAVLRAEVETMTRHLDAQGLDVQRLSGTVAQLREDLRRLREAAAEGAVDPSLINKAMMAELEALRVTRHAEATEMNDILSALMPIIEAEEARAHA